MKSKLIFYKIFFLLFFMLSCSPEKDIPNCHKSVNLTNNSNKIIFFGGRNSSSQIGYNPLKSGDYFKIIPGETKKDIFGGERGCYEDLFLENNNILYYLFFDEQVLQNSSWEDIVANDLILIRYSFTLQEMQAANWTIIYDGD